jgi:hypothetical protein
MTHYSDDKFNNVEKFNEYFLGTQLEHNIHRFLEWGFVNIGGFTNIRRNITDINSTNPSKLKNNNNDPSFPSNTVWETNKKQWIHESGISYKNYSPINISGVYLNNNFLPAPSGSGNYQYRLDYDNGRVIFNKNLSASSDLKMDYSYHNIQIYKGQDCLDEWRILQENTLNSSEKVNTSTRIQMPCIIIEQAGPSNFQPYELGSFRYWASQDIMLHIYSNNYVEKNNIVDIIKLQQEKLLLLFDLNKVIKNNIGSFNRDKSLNANRKNYQYLVNDPSYFWRPAYIKNVAVMNQDSLNSDIFYSTARLTIEIVY